MSPKCSQPPSSLSLWTWIIRGPEGAAFCLLAAPSTRGRAASRGRIVTGEQEARARAKEEGGAGGWVLEPGVCVYACTRVYVSAWEGGMVGSLLARGRSCGPHPEVRNQHLVRMWYVWGTPASGLSVDKDLVPQEQRVFIISPNNHPIIGRTWLPPQELQQAKKPPKQRQPRYRPVWGWEASSGREGLRPGRVRMVHGGRGPGRGLRAQGALPPRHCMLGRWGQGLRQMDRQMGRPET